MNRNSEVIIALCSQLCVGDGVKPYQPNEWGKLAKHMNDIGMEPADIVSFVDEDYKTYLGFNSEQIERIKRLLDRSASLSFEITEYEKAGIHIITRADANYPKKQKIGINYPPVFYYRGNTDILSMPAIGYVGSRSISPDDAAFAMDTVKKTIGNGYAVVSGGAKGVDSISSSTALGEGGYVIEYLGDSILKRMRNEEIGYALQENRILLMSAVKPDAGFSAGNLMARNKYIYLQSEGTVVIKSDLKGGTWSGATEALKNKMCPIFCRNIATYEGNQELIRLGAIPIDETWDGKPEITPKAIKHKIDKELENPCLQISLFD